MNTNVCYTCIFGDSDDLKEPKYINENFDYICFTDDKNLKSESWKIVYINNLNFGEKKNSRYVKILPHLYLSQYEFSIYIDASLTCQDDLNLIKDNICKDKNCFIYLIPHHERNCIYHEFFGCLQWKKDDPQIMYNQLLKYHKENFPYNYGLSNNCIICRYHNDNRCIKLMQKWWNEILNGSHRDQLSLFYSIWKTKLKNNICVINSRNLYYIYKCFDYINSYYHKKY